MVVIANIPDVREINSDDAEALGRLRSGLNPNVQRTAVFAVDIPRTAILIIVNVEIFCATFLCI